MASVNTDDERLKQYDSTKNNLINQAQTNYNKVSSGAEQKYNELINATKDYGKQQAEITQAKTDQAITEINQQKDFAEKDYIKEQKGAYTDYAKQTNAYGTNAETQAVAGLTGSGYSESSKVNMYNTYQNRYMTAREAYNKAVLNYDNQIAQARLQNSAQLAEIAFQTLQTQLQLALEGFQYQNELVNNLINQKLNITSTYDNLWQSRYNTLLNESQFNEQMAYQRERDAIADAQWQQQFSLSKASANRSSGGGGGGNPTIPTDDETKIDKVDSYYQKYKKQEQQLAMTDDIGSIVQHTTWRDRTGEEIAGLKDLNQDEKKELLKKLKIYQGNYGK